MPNFAYIARDSSGASATGTITANTIAEVTQMLRREGKYPTSIQPAGTAPAAANGQSGRERGAKITRGDVIQISTQLSIMVETGVTLSEALDCIASQSDRPNVKQVVQDLASQVQAGGDFSSALMRHQRSFPRLYIALIRASEKSGMLAKLLVRATNYLRDEQETMRRVKGALTYPSIMLAFAVTTTVFLLTFVLPKFTAIYAGKGAALPVPTVILMALSGFIVGHWMMLLTGLIVVVVGGYFYIQTPGGARSLHFVQLNSPLFGPMFRKLHLSRGLRMMGTLTGAGVNLIDCVQTARDLCSNTYFRNLWETVESEIHSGKQLSDPLFQSSLVPKSIAQMIHSAEKGGKLSQVLEQVSTFAEQELKEKIADMTRYIEPVMIAVMGLIIGGVALALLLPIFSISKVVAH
jgi:type IV pilus assembly protein PilC